MGLDGVVEGVALVDLDLDAAGADVVEQLAREGRTLVLVRDEVRQRGARHVERALHRELHGVDRGDLAGGRAEADEQATARERVDRALVGRAADAVVDDRHAGPVGDLPDPGRDVLAGVDDGVLAAVRHGDGGLRVRGDAADDLDAEQARPLREEQADPAGRGVQQHRVARLQAGAMRRSRYDVVRPRIVMAAAVSNAMVSGQLDEVVGRHDPLGAVRAQRAAGVGDPVALGEVVDTGTHGLDDARALDAHPGRQRRRVEAAAEVGVREVQADGQVPHADLAGAGRADLERLPLHDLGATGLVEANAFRHVFFSCTSRGVGHRAPRVWFRVCARFGSGGGAGGGRPAAGAHLCAVRRWVGSTTSRGATPPRPPVSP